jgi:glycosyltransferase involved in cell wall biosynthesis
VERQSGGAVRGFASRSAPLPSRLWSARRAILEALASKRAPDIVAVHFALFALPGLDRLRSRPLIVHFHGPWAEESRIEGAGRASTGVKIAVERLIYRRANRIVALSQAFAEILERVYGVPRSKISIIPGGVDCGRFDLDASRAEARARLGWEVGRPTVLVVRRLARRMGLPAIISSMLDIRERVPDVRLLIAGKGDQAPALQRLIEELDLAQTVRLAGFIPDGLLPWAYKAADLTVVPSTQLEGFGLITAESLAAGTPVLVTPVGGLPETVAPLQRELVLRGCAPEDLARGISGALTGALPLPSAAQCSAYARERFDWTLVAARMRDLYVDALR